MNRHRDSQITDDQWHRLLQAAHDGGPDAFFNDRLVRGVKEGRVCVHRRSVSRLVAAAVVCCAVGIVALFAWQTNEQRLAQGPKLEKAMTDLRSVGKRTEAALAIHRSGAAAVPFLIAGLGDKDPEFVEAVEELLAAAGKPAVQPLGGLLTSQHRLLQLRAIQTLGRMGPEAAGAIPNLLLVLQQAGAPKEAITTLGTLVAFSEADVDRDKLYAAIMAAVYTRGGPLSKPQPHTLVARAARRAQVAERQDRRHLHELLESEDPFEREFAAELLRSCGDAASVPLLAKALEAEQPRRTSFKISVAGSGISASSSVIHDIPIRVAVARTLVRLAPGKAVAAPAQALLLSQGTVLERHAAAEALGRIGVASPVVLESLRGQLGRRDTRLVAAVVTSLGMLGPAAKDAVTQLEAVRQWGNKELQARVAAALKQIEKE